MSHEKHAAQGAKPASVFATWWTEICSSLLALGCILAIVVVLVVHQGRPLPGWPSLISINSLIAVFTAVFKAALIFPVAEGLGQLKWNWFDRPEKLGDLVLFDSASRGPWGSFKLLMNHVTRPQRGYLATLGALITVAALAIDSFSQAIVNHRGCEAVADFGRAAVSRTNNYSTNPFDIFNTRGYTFENLDLEMEKAIEGGLTDRTKVADLAGFECASGNCTFEQEGGGPYFSSLAMCHSCQDVTHQVESSRPKGWLPPLKEWYLPWRERNMFEESVYNNLLPAKVLFVSETPFTVYLHDAAPPLLSFDLLAIQTPPVANKTLMMAGQTPLGVQCRFDPCVKRYSARVSNGVYAEEEYGDALLLKRRPGPTTELSPYSESQTSYALVTDTVLVDGEEKKCEPTADGAEGSVRVGFKDGVFRKVFDEDPMFKELPYHLTWMYYPQECVWVVPKITWQDMKAILKSMVEGEVMMMSAEDLQGPLWQRQLFAEGNITTAMVEEFVAKVTASMTATMRRRPYGIMTDLADKTPAALKEALGRVMVAQTCIYVHWGWIAYPATLLALQWAFLAMVFMACGRGRAGWKSSPLPLLFHGLDESFRSRDCDLDNAKQMLEVAERTKVQLVSVEDSRRGGWRFVDT